MVVVVAGCARERVFVVSRVSRCFHAGNAICVLPGVVFFCFIICCCGVLFHHLLLWRDLSSAACVLLQHVLPLEVRVSVYEVLLLC